MRGTLRLIALRHAPTPWNEAGRVQGHSDIALSPAGRALAGTWRLPAFAMGWPVAASPLIRTQETAAAMGLTATTAPALIEMSWGAWEGFTLAELAERPGFAENQARGLDFRPEQGESPREVMARLEPFLRDLAGDSVAVTHKGVLRALLALATGWDFLGRPPAKLRRGEALLFRLDGGLGFEGSLELAG